MFTGKGRPKHLRERASQVNSFLRRWDLQDARWFGHMHCKYSGELICYTKKARELCNLMDTLTRMLDRESLKKIAETGSKNVKLTILTLLAPLHRGPKYGSRIHELQSILDLYRKRVSRALKILCELKLAEKINKKYYATDLGTEITNEIRYHFNAWVSEQTRLLLYQFEVYFKQNL